MRIQLKMHLTLSSTQPLLALISMNLKERVRMHIATAEIETILQRIQDSNARLHDNRCDDILSTVSVFAMLSNSAREQSFQNECASNMAMVGRMDLYIMLFDHDGNMPTTEVALT